MADKAVFEPMDLMQGKALTVFDDAHDHATARSSKIDCRSAEFSKRCSTCSISTSPHQGFYLLVL